MQPFTRKSLVVLVGALFLGLMVIASMAYRTIEELQDSALSVSQTHEILGSLERLVATIKDAESGQRGYLLTGNQDYLPPYRAARARHGEEINHVVKLVSGNARQTDQVLRLKALTDDKFNELARTVALYRNGKQDAALQVVRSDEGRKLMEEIQSLVGQIEEDERDLLTEQKWAHGNAYREASFSVVAVGSIISAVLGGFAWLLRKRLPSNHAPLAV